MRLAALALVASLAVGACSSSSAQTRPVRLVSAEIALDRALADARRDALEATPASLARAENSLRTVLQRFSRALRIWRRLVRRSRVGDVWGREERSGAACAGSVACDSRRYHLFTVSRETPSAAAMEPCVSPASTRVTISCRAHAVRRAFLWVFIGALAVVSDGLDNLSL